MSKCNFVKKESELFMRIVLVSAIPPPEGGVATWTKRYIEYCDKNKIELRLVNTALHGSRGRQINSDRKILDEIKRTYHILTNMKKSVREASIDIVHINSSCSNVGLLRDYICAKEAYARGIPIILHCHCNVEDQVTKKLAKRVMGKLCIMASAVLTLNKASYDYIKQLSGVESEIVPNFVDEKMFCKNHLIRDEIKEVVFVGHVQKTKGCMEIIEAAKQLQYIHFTLIGPIADEIKRLPVLNNVSFLGTKDSFSIKKYLSDADVFLFPSYTEGFSISLTEAMANGLPCIVTDVGANRDMIEDQGGIIIPTKDAESIVRALYKLEDIEVRRQASSWNLHKVKTSYLPNIVMKSIVSIYKMVM